MPKLKDINEEVHTMTQNVYTKLMNVQHRLKAPKGQYNLFGKYKYRSCEDILEAVKPLLTELGLILTVTDEIVLVGERYYIKATAKILDVETGDAVTNTAYAREDEIKKGMDGSQITGTSSSYARKYALNGLLLIDDTKDADSNENKTEVAEKSKVEQPKEVKSNQNELLTQQTLEWKKLRNRLEELGVKYRSEIVAQWIYDKSGCESQDLKDVEYNTKLLAAYRSIIESKEKQHEEQAKQSM